MFGLGDLFHEEEPSLADCKQNDVGGLHTEVLPASPRLSCGFCGIYNQGATCYMNSLLQTLVMTPEFRESLFSLGEKELGSLKGDQRNKKTRVIPLKLQLLFARLLLLNSQATSTTELTDSFGWNNKEELIQHDVQELNRILFSAIEESLVGTSGEDMIQNLYHGAIVNQTVCEECGRVSEHEEDFLDLCVAVSGNRSLEESLGRCFIQTEVLTGNNQYRCGFCRKLVNAKKGAKLRHLPPLLTISLLRFRFDCARQERYKETTKFTFPLELNMSQYVEKVAAASSTEYELYSVVNHSGGAHGGHYTAYIRDIDNLGQWTHPNEGQSHKTPNTKNDKLDLIECDAPVELIQLILKKHPEKQMAVDKLCMEINKQTGVSWNKRFKSRYGPINKFLKKHEDLFVTSECNRVSLREMMSNGDLSDSSQDVDQTEPRKATSHGDKQNKRTKLPLPEVGHHWFSFNDNRVYPVRIKELEKLYSGKSSAYMLFYRQKDLKRPPDAQGNPEYGIPQHLIQMIKEENQELENQRKMYEVKMNMVVIKLLFPQLLIIKQGVLQTKDNMLSYVELAIDKRKTVSEFLEQIQQIYEELLFGEFVVHFARLLPAGIHVYHCISDQPNKLIAEINVTDEGFLLVWDGKHINGEVILTGAGNEPIQLTFINGDKTQFNHIFHKSQTVADMKFTVCNQMAIDPRKAVISKINENDSDTEVNQLLQEHLGKTLAEMKFTDGDRFVVEDHSDKSKLRQPTKAKVKEDGDAMSYIIENRCGKMTDGDWPLITIKIAQHATVGDLKSKVLSELYNNRQDECVCRLRPEDSNLGILPPVPECVRLSDMGMKSENKMILEPGLAPQTDQLCLTFTSDKPDDDEQKFEVLISSHKTVRELLHAIIEKSRKEDVKWHLRRTNWCGEAADVLDDLDLTLVECQLKSGDHLLLEKGILPPKGCLKLNIQLYPTISHAKYSCTDMLSSHMRGLNGLVNITQESSDNKVPVHLGEVLISVTDTVEDLKLMILALPEDDNLLVPIQEFLRVRQVEDECLTTVLRDHKQTLQKSKLTNDMTLGVQVLNHEENLSNRDILLEVKLHLPGTRTYLPSVELVWDTSSGPTPASLKQAIASQLSLSANNLVIAKYCANKYDWLLIEDNPHQKESKKKRQKKVNLKQAPYHIQDGSIIGVKDLDHEKVDISDFCTQKDLDGQRQLQLEADERRKRREQMRAMNAALNSALGKQHKEMAIKIHVDNYR